MIYIVEESINKMGGVERIVSTLANNFCNKHQVKVISFYKDGDEPFFKYDNRIETRYLIKKSKNYKLKNKINYLSIVMKWLNISKKMKETDVIIFGRVSVASKLLPFTKCCPKIIVRDAINIFNHSSLVKKIMYRQFPKKVDLFLISSDESMLHYKEFFGKKFSKMKKIYNPLAINLSLKKKYTFNNKTILSLGRFDNQKGFENLIKAFGVVNQLFPEWKLRIIGDGELKNKYLELISKNNIQNIELAKPSKEIENELNNASIFVMTSRYEGYANALVEAGAFGIPLISFDWLTGVEEIINDKKNGIIVKLFSREDYKKGIDTQQDIDNLSQAIISLISDKKKCEIMSKNDAQIIDSRNKDNILAQWEEFISSVGIKSE